MVKAYGIIAVTGLVVFIGFLFFLPVVLRPSEANPGVGIVLHVMIMLMTALVTLTAAWCCWNEFERQVAD